MSDETRPRRDARHGRGWHRRAGDRVLAGAVVDRHPAISEHDCRRCEHKANVKPFDRRFIMCRTCGNKRCPKATDHELGCTGSNEPGQLGSDYR